VKDTAVADTSSADTAPADTGVPAEDSGAPDNSLPEQSACSCDVPGNDSGPSLGAVLGLALGALLVARRRRRS
jgi:MYXO-CTERM domain-containing protein